MISLRALDRGEAGRQQSALIELLEDAVASGASVGFLLPLARAAVEAYWLSVASGMPDGRLQLLAAFEHDCPVGSVQIGQELRANGRHRAEMMKLMVRRSHRRRGMGRSLTQAALDLACARAAPCCCSSCARAIRPRSFTARLDS